VRGIGDTTMRFERSCQHTHYTQTHYKRPIVDPVAPSRLNKKTVMVRNAMLLDKRQIILIRRIHKQFHEKLDPFQSPEGVELFPRHSELPKTTLEGTRIYQNRSISTKEALSRGIGAEMASHDNSFTEFLQRNNRSTTTLRF
jgi:hypothetical protein